MAKHSEKDLDRVLKEALSTDPAFASWFLRQTKFADLDAKHLWSRSDHPWGRFSIQLENPDTGERGAIVREGETDALAIFQTSDGRRVAVHIENKLATGRFTPFQLALYNARAKAWKGHPKYKHYDDWEIVLLAPRSFYERYPALCAKFGKYKRYPALCAKFGKYIAHEDIAQHLPAFRAET